MKNSLRLLSLVLSLAAGAWCQISGTISATSTDCSVANSCLTMNLPINQSTGYSGLVVSLNPSSFSGTLTFEVSGDNGLTYTVRQGYASTDNSTGVTTSTASAVSSLQFNVSGWTRFRVRASAYSSGSVVVNITPSPASASSGHGGGSGGGITSINGDTTAAQTIVQGTGISVSTAAGATTVTNTSPGAASAGSATAVQSSNGSGAFSDSGCTATGGAITCVNGVSAGPVAALATYGACNTGATAYKFAGINDGTTNVIGATVSGGGSINESVFCNTTAWTCAAGCTAPSGSFTAAGDLSGNATSQNVIDAHWTVHATVTSGPYTVASTDYFIPCDATSGTIVLNLPAATGSGKEYAFKKLDATASACAITPNGTDTIDTVNVAQNITTQYANQVLIDSASGKWIRKQIIAMAGAIIGASNNTSIAVGTLPNGMTATTQSPGDNTTNIATDAFVLANASAGTGIPYAVGAGTGDAQTVALSPAWTSYVAGKCLSWAPTANNTIAAPTLSVNGLATLPVVRVGGGSLGANDISTTQVPAIACLDGTAANFQLQNPSPSGVINAVHTGLAFGNSQTVNTVLSDDSFTPSVDGTFMLLGSVTETGFATGCSTQGAVKFVISGIDADSNYTYPQNTTQGWVPGMLGQAGTVSTGLTLTASVGQPGSSISIIGWAKRWKAGTAVHVALLASTQPVGCTGSNTLMYRAQMIKVQ